MVFSFNPPMGSTRPRKVISPVIAYPALIFRSVRAESMAVAMAIPAEGPSLGTGALREVDVNVPGLVEVRLNAQGRLPGCAGTERRLGGFLHDVAEIAGSAPVCRSLP